jgi:hypothetical protein
MFETSLRTVWRAATRDYDSASAFARRGLEMSSSEKGREVAKNARDE